MRNFFDMLAVLAVFVAGFCFLIRDNRRKRK
jgi:preprotein translocase subunit YajC